ncbi:MAG: CDP-glycerol glycerophosphotransferase family protein [Acidobacteria bacterium]|nr:CDP-glycerol glycerophosphotransferase family protein [Acidobacteriota bacterium]
MSFAALLKFAQQTDAKWQRHRHPENRSVLVDSRTAMNYAIVAPLHRMMRADHRVQFYFTASEMPQACTAIYREAGAAARLITPQRAALMKFDAYLTADQLWVKLPRGTRRIQMFHGVAGKYGHIYDTPARSMREWHRLFFINQRRLNNYLRSGAIDADSPAAQLIGMPKLDCLLDGSLSRKALLESYGFDPARQTVLYAPTWSPYSSVNALGLELIERLCQAGYAVIVKLHDRSQDTRFIHSGGVNWRERIKPILEKYGGHLAQSGDACPYLAAADVLITDHSSVGFEYLLLDRPVIRIEMPELIARTNIHQDYVQLLAEAASSVRNVEQTLAAVEQAFAAPREKSSARQHVAQELFYQPGTATVRAVKALYEVMELELLHQIHLRVS